MLTLSLIFLLPHLLITDANLQASASCELVAEGYKTYHCFQLSTEQWAADVHEASPAPCLAKCEENSDCTHVAFHLDDNEAFCELQDCAGNSGFSFSSAGEDYFYHESSCWSSYQCRPVVLASGAEPLNVSFPEDVTPGCHGVDASNELSCASYDRDACAFFGATDCYWAQDSCTMVNLGAEAVESCEDPPAGSIAVFFICFFVAGCIAAVLSFNCPEFVEKVTSDVKTAAKSIFATLYSVFSASWGLYEGINVSVVLGCLKDSVDLGGSCSDALGSMESGTIIVVLFSSLSMILIFVFACGMMWFGLKVTDDLKKGLYFVHFFELGVLIGCAVGLSANPESCSPAFGSIIDDQKSAFTKVVVFTVLYMVFNCMSFLGVTDYISAALGCSGEAETEEKADEDEEATKKDTCCSDEMHVVDVQSLELAPSQAEPPVSPVESTM